MEASSQNTFTPRLVHVGIALLVIATYLFWFYRNEVAGVSLSRLVGNGPTEVARYRERMNATPANWYGEVRAQRRSLPDLEFGASIEAALGQNPAVEDIMAGRYENAITRLLAVEARMPGDYLTASNLGTAYECLGDNATALHWITTDIVRNPQGHYGTEWLHKRILEYKVALTSDPSYLESHPILPLPSDDAPLPPTAFTYDGTDYTAGDVMEALHYQLLERVLFVKPVDPVVASLFYAYARMKANDGASGEAIALLKLAREYGYHDEGALRRKLLQYRLDTLKNHRGTFVVASAVILLGMFLAYRRGKRALPLPEGGTEG